MDTKRYKFKTRKGSTALTDEPFYTGAIKNERILTKKETYKELVKELGGSQADYSAVFIAFAEAIRKTCGRGNCARIEGFGTFRNSCRGGFDTSKGPWVKGRNWIEIVCSELTEFKNALIDAVGVNETEGEKPTVKTVYNVALDDYDVIRLGDEISVGGVNLAPDPEKADEFVALYRDGALVRKAEITRSELNTVICQFAGDALEEGVYKLVVYTRCGDSDESVGVKSASRQVTVKAAE